jgi:acetyl-CoA acyltransferase
VIVAGGVESMTAVPMGGNKIIADPLLFEELPNAYAAMGTTAEVVARQFGITREEQDAFALRSHQRAAAAIAAGKFRDEIVPLRVRTMDNGAWREFVFDTDEGPRADTSLEALAKLKPAFDPRGTVTAGNSSQINDGAAAVVVMEREIAESMGLKPLVRMLAFAVGGVRPDIMGIGPIVAIPKALKLAGLSLKDIGLIELNEAFAAQSLAVIQEAGLDPARVNPNGGAIALGHPLGCTGAKLTASILRELKRRKARYGLVTMCVGGGMGAAGIFENIS